MARRRLHMERLKMRTPEFADENIARLAELFPNCVTESHDEKGDLQRAIDFDQLKQELSGSIVDGPAQRYQLNWPGKREALLAANAPIAKTLRPCREESTNFDTTKNLFIEGDNLDALKLLQETYLGKVKMIYIDPPYNTGNDILYRNDYSIGRVEYEVESGQRIGEGLIAVSNTETNGRFHSDWLSMMYPRLRLARNLLREDGIITVAIDHNEINTLISICDEIFGGENRIGLVTVVHKPEGRNQAKFFGPSNEFMLFYARDIQSCSLRNVVIDDELLKTFNLYDERGVYRLKNFIRLRDGKYRLRVNKPTFWYPVYLDANSREMSIIPREGFDVSVFPITEAGQERTWKTTKETFQERYFNGDLVAEFENGRWEIYEKLRENQVLKTHWLDKKYHGFHFGTKLVDDLLGVKTFDFPKSLYLILDVLKITTGPKDIILDFFAGSATTAHAVMELNAKDGGSRNFILVQIPEPLSEDSEAYKAGYKTISSVSIERIRRAGKKVKDEAGLNSTSLEIGFRVFKIDTSNMKDVYYSPDKQAQADLLDQIGNVKEDRSSEDLLFQVLLDWGVDFALPLTCEKISNKEVYFVDENALAACFDVGLSEDFVKELAKRKPLRAVFRDAGFASDDVKINVEQIFKLMSPETEVRSI